MTTDRITRDAQRQINEAAFNQKVRDYILHGCAEFQFGGVLNLITTVRTQLEKLGEETGCRNYFTVAEKLQEVEDIADLHYDVDPPVTSGQTQAEIDAEELALFDRAEARAINSGANQ